MKLLLSTIRIIQSLASIVSNLATAREHEWEAKASRRYLDRRELFIRLRFSYLGHAMSDYRRIKMLLLATY